MHISLEDGMRHVLLALKTVRDDGDDRLKRKRAIHGY
jgi:hypothetical protein